MKKYYWPIIAVVFVIAAGLIIYVAYAPDIEAPVVKVAEKPPLKWNEARLVIDFGAKKRVFVGEVMDRMTLLDALEASVSGDTAGAFDYQLGDNKTLAVIDGFGNDGKEWNIYLNGAREDKAVDEIVLNPKDEIELKLE